MPPFVVDWFEVVQVQEHDRHDQATAAGVREGLVDPVRQQAPVREAGERIVIRQVPDGLLGMLPLDGVQDRADDKVSVAAALDEVVLGTLRQGLDCQGLIGEPAEHDDGDVHSHVPHRLDALEPLRVR